MSDLDQEPSCGYMECPFEFVFVNGTHQCCLEPGRHVARHSIHSSTLIGRKTVAKCGKRESVIAYPADHVLGLLQPSAFDTCARMEGIDPTPSDQVSRTRRDGVWPFNRFAEQQPESRLGRAELVLWKKG